MRDVFVHIGLHKTGTTFLQQHVFGAFVGLNYAPPRLPLSFLVRYPSDEPLLISDEGLSGRPWLPFRGERREWGVDRRICVDHLARLLPNARLLVCFRRHCDMVVSLYKQYLHEGGHCRIDEFFSLERNGFIKKEDLSYADILSHLDRRFSRGMFLFTYEELSDLAVLVAKMAAFFGTATPDLDYERLVSMRSNVGVRGPQSELLRRLNRVSRSTMNPEGALPLYSRYLVKLGLDPRTLCQRRLAGISGREMVLPVGFREEIDEYYRDDWSLVLDRVERSTEQLS